MSLSVVTSLRACMNGKKIPRNRKADFLVQDKTIKRATVDLEEREITLRQFLERTSKNTFNPDRLDLFQDEDKGNL
jgi:hypothetical protein